jgi:hypothetical protein
MLDADIALTFIHLARTHIVNTGRRTGEKIFDRHIVVRDLTALDPVCSKSELLEVLHGRFEVFRAAELWIFDLPLVLLGENLFCRAVIQTQSALGPFS